MSRLAELGHDVEVHSVELQRPTEGRARILSATC
jgi:hypothetical protein